MSHDPSQRLVNKYGADAGNEAVLNTQEAGAYLNLSTSTMNKMRIYGTGPVFLKINRSVRYRRSDLDSWLEHFRVRSTSEADAKLGSHKSKTALPWETW